MNALFSWLTKAQALLSPSITPCLTCARRNPGSSPFPGVCRICVEAIPWIRSPRCLKCGRHVGCPDCTRSSEPSPIICNRSAVAYTSVMREWLGQYKYRGNERYGLLLGLMLERAYLNLKKEKQSALLSRKIPIIHSSWSADLLVPVPVSDSRLMERGFNQAERLADVLSKRRKVPQLPLLIRTHHTGKQSFKSRAERLTDMKHAFAENPAVTAQFADWMKREVPLNRPIRIIIVDDIYTTGSTIRACAEIIQQMGSDFGYAVEVYSLTWARS